MDLDDDISGRSGGMRHRSDRTMSHELAIGGLSLDDFRQDMELAAIETNAQPLNASTDRHISERAARKKFRQHEDREKRWASIRAYQIVPLDNGWRRPDRDRHQGARGGARSCYDTELFGQIRPANSRHPKPKSGARVATPLSSALEQIVDNGLERRFLHALSQQIAARAMRDPELVRHYALLVAGSGFDTCSMLPVDDVDDDRTLKSGDNKRIAERLTALGFPTTTRNVENTKKRLDRLLLDVGTSVIAGHGPKESV